MSGAASTYIVVGCGLALLGELDKILPAGSVTVVEEADLLDAGDLRAKAAKRACVAEVVDGPAQRHDGSSPLPPSALTAAVAVIPSWEYSVVATAACAEAAGVPGAGVRAARTLRDKVLLREAAAAAGMRQPQWTEPADVDDLRAFAAAHGDACVLKPADRQASVGVRLIGPGDDLRHAWDESHAADDAKLRSANWTPGRFLVEQRLHGPEISAEVLVADGRVIWVNVTDKTVWPGTHPVEAGHLLPSVLDASVRARVAEANQQLVDAVGYGTGALHSEWILVDGVEPYLVECAGRLPGDAIVPLIDLAYGGSLIEDFVRVLRGERPERPVRAARGAAVRFVTAPAGVVRAVHGADEAGAVEGVFAAGATVAVGASVRPPASSWDRAGHVLAVGDDGPEAARIAEQAASLITFEVDAPAAD
ncbi:ATP-grasp domain-containing protein [Streptacidiphilus sp. PB12-B1b]|uniref:ATP-grasp domain-containing protein n=1 Tax=Streptacidiphilus sp. PB12-B1b TaxID=2705012 RepID=UPI0015F940FF|nr:ATP-grasp domain-containing protein [Streptacidiphilus sp. PB12-B1b]QMU78107.1 ATP-grasp domain-containing protein [Streptacidiphilus sp. PB12-B1b]